MIHPICRTVEILPVSDAVVVRAADIYADLYRRGLLIGDADILIAATALEHGLPLITRNQNHFRRIAGLSLADWIQP